MSGTVGAADLSVGHDGLRMALTPRDTARGTRTQLPPTCTVTATAHPLIGHTRAILVHHAVLGAASGQVVVRSLPGQQVKEGVVRLG